MYTIGAIMKNTRLLAILILQSRGLSVSVASESFTLFIETLENLVKSADFIIDRVINVLAYDPERSSRK